MVMAGRMKSALCRPPTRVPEGDVAKRIEDAVRKAGMLTKAAA